jgi:hypothetical protein
MQYHRKIIEAKSRIAQTIKHPAGCGGSSPRYFFLLSILLSFLNEMVVLLKRKAHSKEWAKQRM